ANDHPATMLALGAQVVATGPGGSRTIAIDDFFVSLFATALKGDEILAEIRIPMPPAPRGGADFKLESKVGDFATVGGPPHVSLDAAGICQKAGIGLTNVGGTPLRARKAEDFLRGKQLDNSAIKQAAQLAADESEPSTDLRGPADYKKAMVKELTRRALGRAGERARK